LDQRIRKIFPFSAYCGQVITRQKAAVVSDFQRSGPLNLTQGHRNWHGSICRHVVRLWLPINSISVVTLGLSSTVPRYWQTIANSSQATSILGPRSGYPSRLWDLVENYFCPSYILASVRGVTFEFWNGAWAQ